MTTIRQLIQSSPAKANELFARLVDTSESAVKTRDRLFSELKAELDLQSKLEEQHLFPVLKKHKETKDLVTEALNDNRETRKLLSELERTPKQTPAFATKVGELRKVFQQHIRDDKKAFLPAILKALSDEEAESVVGKFEEGKIEVETARRTESDQRRAEEKRERETVATAQRAADSVRDTSKASVESAQKIARTAQDTIQRGFDDATQATQRSTGQLISISTVAGQQARDGAEQATRNLHVVARSSEVIMRGFQAVSREWMDMSRDRFQKNLDGLNAMMQCRSVPELLAAQGALIRQNLELTSENGRRLAQLSAGFGDEAVRSMNEQAEKSANPSARAA